ncbi:MAG: AAA family ATPase [Haloplanus sp.]
MSEPVPTGCAPLDDLLGGGFERGTVTQVYGPPAAGKTNLALSAAVQVAASGGTAVYIDTEGLSVDRFQQLAAAVANREERPSSGNRTKTDDSEGSESPRATGEAGDSHDLETITSRIVVTEAHDFAEQEEAVRDAADFAPRAELIVLDSATGFYRLERHDDDEGETLRRVGRQVTHLLSLARKHDLAVVVTNQVFTDPDGDRSRALGGHTLNHWTGTVLRLDRFRGGNRRATLEKHRSKPAGETATFRITAEGLAAGEER